MGQDPALAFRRQAVSQEVFELGTVETVIHTGSSLASSQSPPPLPTPDVWLDSLTALVATTGWGKVGVNQTDNKSPLVLDGDVYAHGLGLHAPSEAAYELKPSYLRFVARVGAEERAGWRGSIVARVYLDETLMQESPLLRAGDAPWNVDVAIPRRLPSGTTPQRLRLVITDGGNGINCDWCDWVNAGFITRNSR